MKDSIVIVTGGFDPIHSGHLEYIKEASLLGRVMVGVNSDAWLIRKKGAFFMPYSERKSIVSSLKNVMGVVEFDDSDGSAKDAIIKVRQMFPKTQLIFANGGDRTSSNIPEMDIKDDNLIFKFGVGGENKMNSSSWILQEWKAPKTERPWGYYRVLHIDGSNTKVKELTVLPGQSLSMQRHFKRKEFWMVSEGNCKVEKDYASVELSKHETINISLNQWHKLSNPYDEPCRIIEIQYGEACVEEDIEREL